MDISAEYLYTYACEPEERELCRLELRTLLGREPENGCVVTPRCVGVSRSPFVKRRIDIMFQGGTVGDIAEMANTLTLSERTFKIVFVHADEPFSYAAKRAVERELGEAVRGDADMHSPDLLFGIAKHGSVWRFGPCEKNEAIWLAHNRKPQPYSTALGTRMARALANIAVPEPAGLQAVDACCGIGTVVIEALSMGIDIVGFDINPLALRGARINLAHFGMPDVVKKKDMRNIDARYDAAVLDLPYNLCSVISPEDRMSMLASARRFAKRAVVITMEPIENLLAEAGFTVVDGCMVGKRSFSRHIAVCE